MKTKTFLFLIVVSAISFAVVVISALGDLKRQPPTRRDVAGSWVGYEAGGAYFYRLTLREDQQGGCSVLPDKAVADTYAVEQWQLSAGKLNVKVSPTGAQSEAMSFEVTYLDHLCMECLVKGVTNNWERKVTLYNENELLRRIAKCANSGGKARKL